MGLATPNPDGTIGFGLNIVLPDGQSGTVEARISLSGLSGTWRDAGGNTGPFTFGANTGGTPRPAVTPGSGDITGVAAGAGLTGGGSSGDVTLAVNPAAVQSRVTTACPAGQAMRSINQDGTAVCQAATGTGGGDITAVIAGLGLLGGGATGDVTLHVLFGGDGTANAAARADHEHVATGGTSVGLGPSALASNDGSGNTAVGFAALEATTTGDGNSAFGRHALQANITGSSNTAIGISALNGSTAGSANVAVGDGALVASITGEDNVGIGAAAGAAITSGTANTFLGRGADAGSGGLFNATAIGAHALVTRNNSIVLGGVSGLNGAFTNVNVGIGTTAPTARLDIANESPDRDLVVRHVRGSIGAPPGAMWQTSRGSLDARRACSTVTFSSTSRPKGTTARPTGEVRPSRRRRPRAGRTAPTAPASTC